MRDNPLTPDIIIATLNRSNIKTVLVEGKDDIEIYRSIQERLNNPQIDFLPCGGKQTVLDIYNNRKNIKNGKNIMFIADRDDWLYRPIPKEYKEIFLTRGYSIENDLFDDAKEFILNLFDTEERKYFTDLLTNVCLWYSSEVEKLINDYNYRGNFSKINLLSTDYIEEGSTELSPNFWENSDYSPAKQETINKIFDNYSLLLRGKFLFQILEKIFQSRKVKEKPRFHRKQLFESCIAHSFAVNSSNSNINRIISTIKQLLETE